MTGRLHLLIPEVHTLLGKKKSYSTGVHLCSIESGESRFFLYDISSTGRLHPSIPEVDTFLGKKKSYSTGVHFYSTKSGERRFFI